ncbi:MAG: universal stress protein [Roseateles sp.]|uniref:universal stress protein n=1 Tax=Roseateles sp. TaxID=1971397 RepID=UPI0040373C12
MNLAPTPQTVVLATDMSGRCDRALARAVQLSGTWRARLLVVHALEDDEAGQAAEAARRPPSWRQPESHEAAVAQRLRDDLAGEGITADVQTARGAPAAVVLEAARREQAQLVITGLAQDQPGVRRRVGTMADTLLRDPLDVPLLVVRARSSGPYRHVLVATDFSPASRAALATAAHWFKSAGLTLFHAFEVSASDPTGLGFGDESRAQTASRACEQMLAEMALGPEVTDRLHPVFEGGEAAALLPDHLRNSDVDLVVLGSNDRTSFMKKLLGSTTETLLHAIDCDVLVVRGGK